MNKVYWESDEKRVAKRLTDKLTDGRTIDLAVSH